ncbi:CS1 type fimbrial major subunit [Pseudomonas sp.]|uniref:CS1 type fimbrial major subunit n=1 Tax=Pseudomonas sp. TaxID=306 RepID=UPI003981C37F
MSMFKKTMLAAAATALGFVSISAAAETYNISIEATVPNQDFVVAPSVASMATDTHTMLYKPVAGTQGGQLTPLNINFDVKSTNPINAKIGQAAVLSDGTKKIPLEVSFNGVELKADKTEKVSDGTLGAVNTMALRIKTKEQYVNEVGTYSAIVSVLFEQVQP